MRESSLQRLSPCKLIVYLNSVLILLQLGCDFKFQSSAAIQPLPPTEVSSLNTVMYRFKTKGMPSISSSFCYNPITNYGSVIKCNDECYDNENVQNCHISQLIFSGLGLTGTIDISVADLSGLKIINLSNNKLQGPIPDVLGNLPMLETLDLSSNQLSGTIPGNLRNAKSLTYLYLHYNFLTGAIPSSLSELSFLRHLYLDFNMLSGSIPKTLGQLQNLTYLCISENRLTGRLPSELGNLTSLMAFWMPSNYFIGDLPNFENLTQLRSFAVAGNQLSGRLPSVDTWTQLEVLSLQGNNFEGPLPEKYFDLPKLEFLYITDLTDANDVKFPAKANLPNIYGLILRHCSLSGSIPGYISELSTLRRLDLSFNRLTGQIPDSMRPNLIYLSLARNNLNGTIPNWIFQASGTRMDLSYNNFSKLDTPVPSDIDLNVFACCCCEVSTATKPYMLQPVDMMNEYFPRKKPIYHSLFINSGGEQTNSDGTRYDTDNSTSPFHISSAHNWAYSFSGDFLVVTANSSDYTKRVPCRISDSETSLYDDARLSPVSLNYYGFGLHRGLYNVTLHFAEIVYVDDADYNILRKRLFDIYIQGTRVVKDFNIREQAGGPNIATALTFEAGVNESNPVLDIHLYWTGKGSYLNAPAFNGPLIAAISVNPLFKVGGEKLSPLMIALITVASLVAALLLLLALAWSMGWFENKELQVKVKVGEHQASNKDVKEDIKVTLKTLVEATGYFSDEKRIGKSGYLGTVYKAEVMKDPTITVAVKRLHPRHKGKIYGHIKKEIYYMTTLEGGNLVKLWDCHIGESLQLFIYEYMENESLETALFQANFGTIPWKQRREICRGIASGLESLHKNSRIVHGDIKASNVLLNKNNEPKLSDFGFACVYSKEDQFSLIKEYAPTGCLAPEYFQGEDPTVKTDIYSFGVVLLEIVAGHGNKERQANQETTDLVDKVHLHFEAQNPSVNRFIDKKIKDDDIDEQEVEDILRLAALCTSTPSVRPGISDVLSVLNREKKVDDIRPVESPSSDTGYTDKAYASASTSKEIVTSETSPEGKK